MRGALKVQSVGEDDFQVILVDPNRAAAPHEMVLLTSLFGGDPPGAVRDLSAKGSLASAHEADAGLGTQSGHRPRLVPQGSLGCAPAASASV